MSWMISAALMRDYENSLSSPVPVGESLVATCLDGEPSAQLNVMPTPHKFWCNDKTMEPFAHSRFGLTLKLLTEDHGAALLTWYRGDFLANHTALLGSSAGEPTKETSGSTWLELLEKYDLDSSFLKTSPQSCPAEPMCAYAAGLIDGEGAISMSHATHKTNRSYSPEVRISLAVKGRPVLERMQAEFGGILKAGKAEKGNWSATLTWRIGGLDAGRFLTAVGPFLILKSEQAVICLALLKVRLSATNQHPNGNAVWTPEMRARCEVMKVLMTKLNQRGTMKFEPGAFAKLVDGQWVASQADLLSGSLTPYSQTWPTSGSMRDGQCWELPMLAHRIKGTGSGAWLFPTPTCNPEAPNHGSNSNGPHNLKEVTHSGWSPGAVWIGTPTTGNKVRSEAFQRGTLNPKEFVAMFPTPCTVDSGAMFNRSESPNAALRPTLGAMAKHDLWPTPTATLGTHGGLITPDKAREGGTLIEALSAREIWPPPDANMGVGGRSSKTAPTGKRANGTKQQITLNDAAKWATPLSRDHRSGKASQATHDKNSRPLSEQVGGSLNPSWVELLMGWPEGWTDLAPLPSMQRAGAAPWAEGWEDGVPRVASGVTARVHRLRAIGNGQVPLCAATAWLLLTDGDAL
jgi:hypothetical protein